MKRYDTALEKDQQASLLTSLFRRDINPQMTHRM